MPLIQDKKEDITGTKKDIKDLAVLFSFIFKLPQETIGYIAGFIREITCYQLLVAVDIARNAIRNQHYKRIGRLSELFSSMSLDDINGNLEKMHNALLQSIESRFNAKRIRSGYGSSSFLDAESALRISGQFGFQSSSLFRYRLKGVSSFFKASGSFFSANKDYSIIDVIHGPRKLAVVTKNKDGEQQVHIFGENNKRIGRQISLPRIEDTNGHRIIEVGSSQKVNVSFGYQHILIHLDNEIIVIGWNISQQLAFTAAVRNYVPQDEDGDLFVNERLSIRELGLGDEEIIHASACYYRSVFATRKRVFLAGDIKEGTAIPFKELALPDLNGESISGLSHCRNGIIVSTNSRVFAIGDCFNQSSKAHLIQCHELQLPGTGNIIKVTSGHAHVVVWLQNGIYGYGANDKKQIISADVEFYAQFFLMDVTDLDIARAQDILAVNDSTLLLCGGKLLARGKNYSCQLGLLNSSRDDQCYKAVDVVPEFESVALSLHRARYEQQLAVCSAEPEKEELADTDPRKFLIAKRLY